jgi:hypothetical protein
LGEPPRYIGSDNQEKFQGSIIKGPSESTPQRSNERFGKAQVKPAQREVRNLHTVPVPQAKVHNQREETEAEERDRELTFSNATFLESDSSILEIQKGIEQLGKEGPFSLLGQVLRQNK